MRAAYLSPFMRRRIICHAYKEARIHLEKWRNWREVSKIRASTGK